MATNEEFLSTIKEGCKQGWREHAVLASISGAQAILESNWGKSTLALQANNLFGIKGDYNGASFTIETKDFVDGVVKYVTSTFRKYPSWSESVADHSAFFSSSEWRKEKYSAVIGETDYKKAAGALYAAGYATDPDYAAKLIKLIETNDLQQWDVPETETEEETTMAKMKYEIITDIKLADGYCGSYRNGKPEGVVLHEPANTGLIQNQINYELRDPENNGIVHAWSSDTEIREILSTDYKCWGAGGIANARFAQIECCRFDAKARAVASIDRGLFWAAYQLFYYNLPCTDATKNGIGTVWTHLAVSRFLGNTDHTDPIAYWSSVGISWDAAFAQLKRYYDALHAGDSTKVTALGQAAVTVSTPAPASASGGFAVGTKVTVRSAATHYQTGQAIAPFVKGNTYTIKQVKSVNQSASKRAYLLDGINSWVLEQDVIPPAVIAPAPSEKSFRVQVATDELNVRTGPGTGYDIETVIRDRGVYTITSTNGDWGKLKSGAGWISLAYTKRV